MDIIQLRTQVKILCDKIDALDPLDEFTLSDLWDELTVLFAQDENATLTYFEECSDEAILFNLSSVIGYVSLLLQSVQFIDLIKIIAHKNEKFWGKANWVINYVEEMIMPKEYLNALKRCKTPSAWEKRNVLLFKQDDKLKAKITALRDLSQSRHLLIREQIELSFLEKIQSADSLEALQSIENELNNTATDVELIQKLLKYVREKQAFY